MKKNKYYQIITSWMALLLFIGIGCGKKTSNTDQLTSPSLSTTTTSPANSNITNPYTQLGNSTDEDAKAADYNPAAGTKNNMGGGHDSKSTWEKIKPWLLWGGGIIGSSIVAKALGGKDTFWADIADGYLKIAGTAVAPITGLAYGLKNLVSDHNLSGFGEGLKKPYEWIGLLKEEEDVKNIIGLTEVVESAVKNVGDQDGGCHQTDNAAALQQKILDASTKYINAIDASNNLASKIDGGDSSREDVPLNTILDQYKSSLLEQKSLSEGYETLKTQQNSSFDAADLDNRQTQLDTELNEVNELIKKLYYVPQKSSDTLNIKKRRV
jgi:hypothetical protein